MRHLLAISAILLPLASLACSSSSASGSGGSGGAMGATTTATSTATGGATTSSSTTDSATSSSTDSTTWTCTHSQDACYDFCCGLPVAISDACKAAIDPKCHDDLAACQADVSGTGTNCKGCAAVLADPSTHVGDICHDPVSGGGPNSEQLAYTLYTCACP